MDEAQGTAGILQFVEVLQGLADVPHHVKEGDEWKPFPPGGHPLVGKSEGDARHVLHRDEVASLELAEVDHVDDVRMAQPSRQRRLVDEHLHEIGPVLVLRQHRLDHDPLLEALEALDLRSPDLRHASRCQSRFDLVRAELCAGLPRGRGAARRAALGLRRGGAPTRTGRRRPDSIFSCNHDCSLSPRAFG